MRITSAIAYEFRFHVDLSSPLGFILFRLPSMVAAGRRSMGGVKPNIWLATSPAKRATEILYLIYSPFWMVWALCIVVPFRLYESAGSAGYMAICMSAAAPCILLPWLLESRADEDRPWTQKYWVKANVWIAIYSFVGNYFWTHYFYKLLGAAYTFPSWRLNDVPFCLYLMTHAYFCFYHCLANVLLRRLHHALKRHGKLAARVGMALLVFSLSYTTAFAETATIANFPYYNFKDRSKMYSVGSFFYAIYFFVSFPMFFLLDEDARRKSTVWDAAKEALAASMAVTILLDLWRISLGPIVDLPVDHKGLPWLS